MALSFQNQKEINNDFWESNECSQDKLCSETSQEMPLKTMSDSPLQAIKNDSELIINILQEMKKEADFHHTVSATSEHVTTEAELGRLHNEEQFQKMRDTILEFQKYLDTHSAKRQLTIYSSLMLFGSCALFIIRWLRGPLTIDSPIPELAIIVSIAFLMMARYTPLRKNESDS